MRLVLIAVLLSVSAARADDLFPEKNPYVCVWQAKASQSAPDMRRTELAACMGQVLQPYDAVLALRDSGFSMPWTASRAIELAQRGADYPRARRFLQSVIMTGDLPKEEASVAHKPDERLIESTLHRLRQGR